MRLVARLAMVVVVHALVLSLLFSPIADNVSADYAPTTGWTYQGTIDLEDEFGNPERWVLDATVIKDDTSDYKMWYTHVKLNKTYEELLVTLTNLNTMDVLDAFLEMRMNDLFAELAALNEADVWDLIEGFTTAIGYATSTDGINWTVVDSEVVGGDTGDTALTAVGAPAVINDGGTYKMWYTRIDSDFDEASDLTDILDDLGGDQTARETAITNLMNSTRTVIYYATWDGTGDWIVQNGGLPVMGGGDILSSVGTPAVVLDDTTLRMWYTRVDSDVAVTGVGGWAATLADTTFVMDDLVYLLDGTAGVIGYATSDSTDGVSWTVVNDNVLLGGVSAWESVSSPSVVKANGTYEMWYTGVQTNLTTASQFTTLKDQINALALGNLWTALQNLNITDLLYALVGLDLDDVKTTLSGTSTVIGYATSTNGTTWNITADDLNGADVFPSGVPGPWYGVGSPSVIGDGSNYTIWFTEGVEDLDVANLGEYLLLWTGDTSTIGQATYQYSGGGGGGGGGGAPAGTTYFYDKVDSEGYFIARVVATSTDSLAWLIIPEGTLGQNAYGNPVVYVTIVEVDEPPTPPPDHSFIGLVYDFGPEGNTFDPPITLTIFYDPELIPDGVAEEDLSLFVWDEDAGAWVKLDSVVDTEEHSISIQISGFSTYAIMAYYVPATFSILDISISPGQVDINQTVEITATVSNSGTIPGTYQVALLINDEVEDVQEITLGGGESTTVSFEVMKSEPGSYTVRIGGMTGSFTVREAEVIEPPVTEPEADIAVNRLWVTPPTPAIGETVTISVLVKNRGDAAGSHEVTLIIDGEVVESKTVDLEADSETTVTFSYRPETTGIHTVEVDDLSTIFAVLKGAAEEEEEPAALNWWLIGGIIGGCAVITAIVAVFLLRRRFGWLGS